MRANILLILLPSFVFIFCTNKNTPAHQNDPSENHQVFKQLPSEETQLVFSNTLTENIASLENLFNYDYFYNGAGVGVEDLNNDGLLDIFFCGNQVPNTLFFNQGNMLFEEVSEEANINNGKIWANGVTFVDINSDGWMDVYVSQGGPNQRLQRKNLLFLNQQDGTFLEKAQDYGLDDMGISTQSVFFDYDKDGDLDCLVMNENEYYGVDPIQLFQLAGQNEETQYFNSSHLYRNDRGKFKDVTEIAGLERPIFGLGLSVSDINEDGWLDIYVASDYYIPDALFVNNQDGTFSDQIKTYTNQISFYGMGMDIADLNNDALQDIFVLDMASNDHVRSKTLMASMNTKRFDYLVNKANFHHQYMFNSLQLNTGFNKFSNIAQGAKVANTDWSWSVLMSDFDHDQDKDIYITNGYRRYALDNDLQRKVFEAKVKYKNNVPLEVKKRLYEEMPSEKLPNILYENNGNLEFNDHAHSWGLADHSFSNGAAIGDLDNDGDLDLVVNNMDENCFLYQNLIMEQNGGNYLKVKAIGTLSEAFPRVTLYAQEHIQFIETRRVRGYRSSHENVAHFGLGALDKIDSLIIKWPNGGTQVLKDIETNTTVLAYEKNAVPVAEESKDTLKPHFVKEDATALGIAYTHQENPYDDFEREILLPYKQSTLGPFITKGDFNGDTLEDFFVGGASGQAGALFIQTEKGSYVKKVQEALEIDRSFEDMEAVAFDYENDGDLDLYVVSGGNAFAQYSSYYADRLYVNDGKGNLQRKQVEALDGNTNSGKAVIAIDFDKDGDMDIMVGNRVVPQNYPVHSPSIIYENQSGKLVDVTDSVAPELRTFGIVNSLVVTDFNGDGWQDFIAVGEWTEIGVFKNEQGVFRNSVEQSSPLAKKGWWYSVTETDINNDGLPDYLVGNVGSNIKFSASREKPFRVYANDFDDNGTPDIVLSKKYQGEYVPVRGRECSSQQMPFIQQKFETYSEFANAKLVDIYGDKLLSAYQAEVTEFRSVLLLNKGEGQFEVSPLPNTAQFFPIMESVFLDVNGDGLEDAIVAGNIYNTEVETPRLDAISGLVLLSNGKNSYHTLSWEKSGILLDGNVKDLTILNNKKNILLLAAQNDGPLALYEFHK
ncbi:MAG: VCBS repeat-containing protein [Bacteroidota bacterium]